MKPHLRVKLRTGSQQLELPHWSEILADKTRAVDRFLPPIDRLLDRYHVPIWATHEYKPAGTQWSPAELHSGLNRVYRLVLQRDEQIPPDLISAITLLPMIEEARVGAIGQVNLPPLQSAALSVKTDRASREAIYLDEAQRFTRGDPAITIAVLDTGVDLDHPEYRTALLPGFDFVNIIDGTTEFIGDYVEADEVPGDEVGHGTHVTGIIAAQGRNMPDGVAPNCRILPVRVLAALKRGNQRLGAGLIENINAGLKWAIDHGADVINMSLGVEYTGGGLPHQEVVEYAQHKGVTIVAASGNDGTDKLYYPGAFESVITVGALNEIGEVAEFSTYGRQVSLVAPGQNIYSTYLNRDYAFSTGTSHAAPFVSGAVALLKSYARARGHTLSDRQVKHTLKHTADKLDQRFKHPRSGYGKINLIDAVRLLDRKLSLS